MPSLEEALTHTHTHPTQISLSGLVGTLAGWLSALTSSTPSKEPGRGHRHHRCDTSALYSETRAMQGAEALGCSLWQLSLDLGVWKREEDSTGRGLLWKHLLWMVALLKQERGKLWLEPPGCLRWEDTAQRGSRHTTQGQAEDSHKGQRRKA